MKTLILLAVLVLLAIAVYFVAIPVLLIQVLAAFGVTISFWTAVGILVLVGVVGSAFRVTLSA